MNDNVPHSVFSSIRTWLLYRVGVPILNAFDFVIKRTSLIGDASLIDPARFPWARELEEDWGVIRDELESLIASQREIPNLQDVSKDLSHLTQDDKWKMFLLFAYGYKSKCNCDRFPQTMKILESIPGITNAVFSFLSPGKHIPRHRGEYRGLLRCHLGLVIPRAAKLCRMEIDGSTITWSAGELVIFDNSYHHEVWNETSETRVILMFDVIRPLRRPWSWLNRVILFLIGKSPYVRSAKQNQQRLDAETTPRSSEREPQHPNSTIAGFPVPRDP
jgi:ornithine lipid ester-linked acyl 2-hydroxylase